MDRFGDCRLFADSGEGTGETCIAMVAIRSSMESEGVVVEVVLGIES